MGLDIPNSNQMFLGTRRNITKKANRLFYGSVLGSWLIDKNSKLVVKTQNHRKRCTWEKTISISESTTEAKT